MLFQLENYLTFETIYLWASFGVLPFWLLLIFIPNSKITQIFVNSIILSLAAIRASLSIFDEVGMDKLVAKSKKLTNFLLFLLDSIETDRIEIITPEERGCQLSIRVKNGNKILFDAITEKGVVADWREPDVIRVAPIPLYNSFQDVFNFYTILKEEL